MSLGEYRRFIIFASAIDLMLARRSRDGNRFFFVCIDPRDSRDVREHVRSEREEISELMEVPRSHGMKKVMGIYR